MIDLCAQALLFETAALPSAQAGLHQIVFIILDLKNTREISHILKVLRFQPKRQQLYIC